MNRYIVRCGVSGKWTEYWVAAGDKAKAAKFVISMFPKVRVPILKVIDMDDPEDAAQGAVKPEFFPEITRKTQAAHLLGVAMSPVHQKAVERWGHNFKPMGRPRLDVPEQVKVEAEPVRKAESKAPKKATPAHDKAGITTKRLDTSKVLGGQK